MTQASIVGNSPTAATGNITGLSSNTLYHYRVKATNAQGITTSADATFTTLIPASINSIDETSIQLFPNPVVDYLMYQNKMEDTYWKFRAAKKVPVKLNYQ